MSVKQRLQNSFLTAWVFSRDTPVPEDKPDPAFLQNKCSCLFCKDAGPDFDYCRICGFVGEND